MRFRGKRFELDRSERKLFGVCAGISNATGLDVTAVRVGVVLLAIFASFFWVAAAYGAIALVGHRHRLKQDRGYSRVSGRDEVRERMRNHDLRMQAIETYVTSSNSRLAREIEDLR